MIDKNKKNPINSNKQKKVVKNPISTYFIEIKKKLIRFIMPKKEVKLSISPHFNQENVFEIENYNFWYLNKKKQALFDLNVKIKKNRVTALIGPSGCGKSTFLISLNRMCDLIEGTSSKGSIFFEGTNIYSKKLAPLLLRTKVGMVFQKPTPFPMSIYENVTYGPKSHGIHDQKTLKAIVERSLIESGLWDEVKDNLDDDGTSLSGGQQQRLCIARAIALQPDVLLMDEPTSALDPIATAKIENLIKKLKSKYTIIIVTHSLAQAQRTSDETVFFFKGKIIEHNTTRNIFLRPVQQETKDYINGKVG